MVCQRPRLRCTFIALACSGVCLRVHLLVAQHLYRESEKEGGRERERERRERKRRKERERGRERERERERERKVGR